MARIKYSALIENIQGSIAGTTFQGNKYGYTVKKKPNIIYPRTLTQQRQQKYFALAVNAWRTVSSAVRADWDAWAATYPQYAKHNPEAVLSGYALFVKLHIFRFMKGDAVLTNPTYTVYPEYSYTLALQLSGGALYINVSGSIGAEDFFINFSLSRPFNVTQSFIGTKYRYVVSGTDADGGFNVSDAYVAKFGALPAVGQYVAIYIQPFAEYNGQMPNYQSEILQVAA